MNHKKTSSWRLSLALAAAACLLAGCIPKNLVWSPDGQTAAVVNENGVYLCDTNGTLTGPIIKDVGLAAWFPDSKRLAVARSVKYSAWSDLAPLLTPERRDRIEREAEKVLEGLKTGLTRDQAAASMVGSDAEAVALRLKEIPGARETLTTNWAEVEKAQAEWILLQIATISGGKATLSAPLAAGLDGIDEIRVSPDGRKIAYVGEEDKHTDLNAVLADGSSAPQLVDWGVTPFPDWTPDSRALAYIKAVGVVTNEDQLQLGSLARRAVADGNDAFHLEEKPEEMVAMVFSKDAKVRCLGDGRILFSGAEVHLPSTAADMPKRQQLFSYRPGANLVEALIPADKRDQAPQDTCFFEVDPSGARVSLVEDGLVAVIELATGELRFPPQPMKSDVPTLPVWRTPEELCYVTSPATGPAQLALWHGGEARIISLSWPAEVRKGVLDH